MTADRDGGLLTIYDRAGSTVVGAMADKDGGLLGIWNKTGDEVVQAYTLTEGRDCPAVSLYVTFDEATLEIRSFTGKAITDVVYVHPGRTDVKRIGPEGTTAKQFATLSAALRAAAEESSNA